MGFLVGDWDPGLKLHDEFMIVARIVAVIGSETLQGWKLTQNDHAKAKNIQPTRLFNCQLWGQLKAKSCEKALGVK